MKRTIAAALLFVPLLALSQSPPPAASSTRASNVDKLLEPDAGPPPSAGVLGVVLSSRSTDQKLDPVPGTIGSTYAFVTALIFSDFPGLHADVRVTEPKPTIHVLLGGSPNGRVFLVKAQSNDKTGNRSVKIGHSGFGSVSGLNAPDAKWNVPYTATQDSPGHWTLTPVEPLLPGEYGIFVPMGVPASGTYGSGGALYGFGVDSTSRHP